MYNSRAHQSALGNGRKCGSIGAKGIERRNKKENK
jgi:hypothetical protein